MMSQRLNIRSDLEHDHVVHVTRVSMHASRLSPCFFTIDPAYSTTVAYAIDLLWFCQLLKSIFAQHRGIIWAKATAIPESVLTQNLYQIAITENSLHSIKQ